jgi:5-methylcytosine-specific restriction endonuclease McrBC GTP-binding regulatory subunit McrB
MFNLVFSVKLLFFVPSKIAEKSYFFVPVVFGRSFCIQTAEPSRPNRKSQKKIASKDWVDEEGGGRFELSFLLANLQKDRAVREKKINAVLL